MGERLAKEFIQQGDIGWQLVDRISLTISEIDIDEEQLMKQLLHMKHDTATGPDDKMSATTATLVRYHKNGN